MALGGVATGIMKAQDAEIAAAANKGSTSIFSDMPIVINTGSTILAVAVLDVISVKKLIPVIISSVNTAIGRKSRYVKCSASQVVRSVVENPLAITKPAPKSNNTSQGIFLAASQFINGPFPLPAGMVNINRAPKIAMMVSSSIGSRSFQ